MYKAFPIASHQRRSERIIGFIILLLIFLRHLDGLILISYSLHILDRLLNKFQSSDHDQVNTSQEVLAHIHPSLTRSMSVFLSTAVFLWYTKQTTNRRSLSTQILSLEFRLYLWLNNVLLCLNTSKEPYYSTVTYQKETSSEMNRSHITTSCF